MSAGCLSRAAAQAAKAIALSLLASLIPSPGAGLAAEPAAPAPGTITTFAGGATGSLLLDLFKGPQGVAVATTTATASGVSAVYVSDTFNHRVKRIDVDPVATEVKPVRVLNVAGRGVAGFSGDGGQATEAKLNRPHGLAVGSNGDLYIADTGNNVIRKVAGGVITTVAGTGIAGYSGDGMSATASRLYQPHDVALDANGDLLIADTYNHRIRKVASGGTITTVAGTGVRGDFGDGEDPTLAKLNYPRGVAQGATGMFIADTHNHRIRKVTATIETVAGNGDSGYWGDGGDPIQASLSYPWGVEPAMTTTAEDWEDFYVADSANDVIRAVTATVTGTGTVTSTGTESPTTESTSGTESTVTKTVIELVEKIISTVAGAANPEFLDSICPPTGLEEARSIPLRSPSALALDGKGSLLIAATVNNCLRSLDLNAANENRKIRTFAGSGILLGCCADDGLPARQAILKRPGAVAVHSNGETTMTYVADTGNNRVVAIDQDDTVMTVAGRECRTNDTKFPGNDGPTQHSRVPTVAGGDLQGFPVRVTPTGVNTILDQLDPSELAPGPTCLIGDYRPSTFTAATDASLNQPWGIAIYQGDLYIADTYNHRIRRVTHGGLLCV